MSNAHNAKTRRKSNKSHDGPDHGHGAAAAAATTFWSSQPAAQETPVDVTGFRNVASIRTNSNADVIITVLYPLLICYSAKF